MPSGLISPVSRQRQFTDLGVTAPGALAYFWAGSSDTPATTYSDSTLSTANSQPVVAGAGGQFGPIYLAFDIAYEVEVKTSTGLTLIPRTAISVGGNVGAAIRTDVCDGRLTLTSGTPVTVSDVTAATTLYFCPDGGNQVAVYSGTAWVVLTFTELSYALAALAATTNYDVFLNYNSGTPALELTAWTDATTRATAITRLNGVWTKSGASTRRYLGTIRTVASGQTEDSIAKRFVFNVGHRVPRLLQHLDSTTNWSYTTATWRQARADTNNQVDVVIGVADSFVSLMINTLSGNSTTLVSRGIAFGEDSITVPNLTTALEGSGVFGADQSCVMIAQIDKVPAVGKHYYAWLEYSQATGTTTWAGGGHGISGFVWA